MYGQPRPTELKDGCIVENKNEAKPRNLDDWPKALREKYLARKKHECEMVTGTYINQKNQQNGKFEGWFADYPDLPMRKYRLMSGRKYTIPRGLKKKLTNLKITHQSDLIYLDGSPIEGQLPPERIHLFIEDSDY